MQILTILSERASRNGSTWLGQQACCTIRIILKFIYRTCTLDNQALHSPIINTIVSSSKQLQLHIDFHPAFGFFPTKSLLLSLKLNQFQLSRLSAGSNIDYVRSLIPTARDTFSTQNKTHIYVILQHMIRLPHMDRRVRIRTRYRTPRQSSPHQLEPVKR
jgi:hypothetical protein